MGQVIIIGIGNIFRGDDAVGLAASRKLRELGLPGVEILDFDGDISHLAEAWQEAREVVIIDAASSKAEAGTIYRFEAHAEPLPRKLFATCCSCHAFGLAHQIEVARALRQLPPRLIVFGVEGKAFGLGSSLSPEVAAAVPEVIRRVLEELTL
jgi:hydrogenase maturation protease